MPTAETIAALSTPHGRDGRALVRLSGHDLPLGEILDRPPPAKRAAPARLQALPLPVLAMFFPGPASYTGEDVLELQLPANPILLDRVLDLLLALPGVRAAEPGEFTARAYLAGRLSLAEAEGIAARIAAASAAQLRAAERFRTGEAGALFAALADELAQLLALVEAGIDFTDQEDVVAIAPADLRHRLSHLVARIDAELGPASRETASGDPLVALAGAPNAGKSTLFNALLGSERAVSADLPGTTRDALVESLDLAPIAPGAGCVRLADLPGLDLAPAGEADRAARERALDALRRADAIVHCDPTGRFGPLDAADPRTPTIRVRTKADLPGPDGGEAIGVCALDGWNLDALRRAIADVAAADPGADASLLPRHRRALAEARAHAAAAIDLADPTAHNLADPELVADSLRLALDRLGELAGRISPDEVIGRVFSTFCVGK